jgi:ubiquinone/menaquinone biosynthesis C-methylase UbiE
MVTGRSVRHPIFARLYPRMAGAMDRGGMAEHRSALLAGLTGQVIEIGAGNGANFAHYPSAVTRVLAVEPEPRLRHLATTAAEHAPVPVQVVDGLADQLPADDASADAVVATLVLCSVPDQHTALREIRRVLTPDGRLHFLEHVRAPTPGMARAQRIMDATFWPHLAGGCHTGRDTTTALDHLTRFRFPDLNTPTSTHITGTARSAS